MKYIDADRLKQAILDRYVPLPNREISLYEKGRADAQDEMLDLINALSREDLSTGQWVQIRRYDTKARYMCSECGRKITSGLTNPEKSYPYCHCGARMEG